MATPLVDAATPARLIDLLKYTDARVAVSSRVDNAHDFPEHLVDGKPETAWNGRSGDLVGGFILFAVPDDAEVVTIALSIGFDKTSPKGEDLFTANHRIKKVRVTRNDALVREMTFDLGKRKPQEIPIGKKGGTYRIDIVEVEPGTRKEWRELVVSELAVLGRPGQDRRRCPRVPEVRVGSLAPVTPSVDAGDDRGTIPFSSIAAFCAHHQKRVETALAKRPGYGVDEKPYCAPDSNVVARFTAGPFTSVRSATIWDELAYKRVRVLLLDTQAGLYETTVRIQAEPSFMATCGPNIINHSWFDRAKAFAASGRTWALLHVIELSAISSFSEGSEGKPAQEYPGGATYEQHVHSCALASGRLTCTSALVARAEREILKFDVSDLVESKPDLDDASAKKPIVRDGSLAFE